MGCGRCRLARAAILKDMVLHIVWSFISPLPHRTAAPGVVKGPVSRSTPGASAGSDDYFYTSAVKVVVEVPVSIAPGMAWDGFWRLIYDKTNEGCRGRQRNC